MKYFVSVIIYLAISLSPISFAASLYQDYDGQKIDYQLDLDYYSDTEAAASLGRFTFNNIEYGYVNHVGSHLSGATQYALGIPVHILTNFLSVVLVHETGHGIRAREYGGDFVVSNWFALPPEATRSVTTLKKPLFFSEEKDLLFSVGGFEGNTLASLNMQRSYYIKDEIFRGEAIYYTLHKLFPPLYFYVVSNVDTTDPTVWTNLEGGDPIEMSTYLYSMQTGGSPLVNGGVVDPRLIDIYSKMKSEVLWAFLDPTLIQMFMNFGDMPDEAGHAGTSLHPWRLGSKDYNWMFGTSINFSSLGLEKYFNNYITLAGERFMVYTKTGVPFKNTGFGIRWENALESQNYRLGLRYDSWDQDYYGRGNAYGIDASYWFTSKLGLTGRMLKKDAGYMIGKDTSASSRISLGFQYRY